MTPRTLFTLRRTLLPLALLFPLLGHAAKPLPTVASVLSCHSDTAIGERGSCPYLYDVLKGDKTFARVFKHTLKQAKVPVLSGPESPLATLKIGNHTYISGDRCEAHNCGSHRYVFIYSPASRKMAGLYQPDGLAPRWFGHPKQAEKETLHALFDRG